MSSGKFKSNPVKKGNNDMRNETNLLICCEYQIKSYGKESNNRHITIVIVILQYWLVEIEGKVAVVILFYTNIQIKGRERITHCAVQRSGRRKKTKPCRR